MVTESFIAFWLVSFLLVMTPGADWAYVLANGAKPRRLMFAVLGMLLGYLMITTVVAAGIGTLVAKHPSLLQGLTYFGAGYLLWLGIQSVRSSSRLTQPSKAKVSDLKTLCKGFVISGLNPKALLLFLALLPPFIDGKASWPAWLQIFALGFTHMVNCGLVYSLIGLGSGRLIQAKPHSAKYLSATSGCMMISFGIIMIFS